MPKIILRVYRGFYKRAAKRVARKRDDELSLNYVNEPKYIVGNQNDDDSATTSFIKNNRDRIERLEEEFKNLHMKRSVYSYKYYRFK